MSQEHVSGTIELVQAEISRLDRELLAKKRLVNELCQLAEQPPIYGDAELLSRVGVAATKPDEYYGMALASAVRGVLEKRKAANRGAATVNEIFDELAAGGYHFQAKNEDNAKRSLYQSLGKNSTTFHKLPNGTYGLREWYPDIRVSKLKATNGQPDEEEKPLHKKLQQEAAAESANEKPAVKTAK